MIPSVERLYYNKYDLDETKERIEVVYRRYFQHAITTSYQ